MGGWSGRPTGGGRRVLMLSWRDLGNPLGGGSERYLHRVATGLAALGDRVTVRTAAYAGAPASQVVDGVRYLRGGTPDTVFGTALRDLAAGRLGRPDVVVDCQNGVPFFSRAATRAPVVVLVHHVHREQWPLAVGPVAGRVGWWLESAVAPRFYRGCRYVAVSPSTRRELVGLGVPAERIAVVPNGLDPLPPGRGHRSAAPSLVVLGRLVPHKQVEHALEVLARLRADRPELTLTVVGDGYWAPQLRARAAELGVHDAVRLVGHVDEVAKHRLLAAGWVHLCPSVKEGWGLAILEAAQHAVPTVAYATAGGTTDSVIDGRTGLLVGDVDELAAATARLLDDRVLRERLGRAARDRAACFTWADTTRAFSAVLDEALAGRRRLGDPATAPAWAIPRPRTEPWPARSAAAVLEQGLLDRRGVARGLLGELDDAGRGTPGDGQTEHERQSHPDQSAHRPLPRRAGRPSR
jgi:glycosyltransferase involved in cell wall biosynthesis